MFDIEYGGQRASALGVRVAKRPDMPVPERNITETQIAGRDGSLIESDGTYADIEIEIEMNFIQRPKNWGMSFRKIKGWLLSAEKKELKFSDDPNVFYKVKNVFLDTIERQVRQSGEFTAAFLCEPYTFMEEGKFPFSPGNQVYNPYLIAKPVYQITGNGLCVLTVNGKSMQAEIGQNLTIDTERMLSYRQDDTIINTTVAGDYEDLWLAEGENTITVTNGFGLTMIPNWRCL